VSWKNFLSTGNTPNKVELDGHSTTLIVGKNGEGKSTILDALTFSLFNKPFRDINKNQLVNSINQKNCVVEIEFDIGPIQYRVLRGIKPNIFEIYQNGTIINQDAAVKDYQKVLEQQILKLNYKTFTQVVILGSASFVPFMQLPVWQRREVIEDILDIKVFSTMNTILKEKIAENKEELSAVDTEIRIITEQAKAQKSLIDSLQHSKDQNVKVLRDKIETNINEINDKTQLVDLLNKDVEALNTQLHEKAEVDKNIEMCKSNMNKLSQKLTQVDEHIEFFTSNETCPSCEQGIQHDHKDKIISKISSDKKQITDNMDVLNSAYSKLSKDLQDKQDVLNQIQDKNISISTEINAMNMLIKANNALEKEINELSVQGDIDVEKDKIKLLANDALQKNEVKVGLMKEKQLQEIAGVLLKDTGIKTTIIREYLPAMNKLINMYLSAMDFFVKFELDESFNEKIKSRFRDEFTYASFSEGEKMRIDLSLLFTWRSIARMKNSAHTNLLILDEVFDASLDANGCDEFLKLIHSLENSNIFVISHKGDVLHDKFSNTLRFTKQKNFSRIM